MMMMMKKYLIVIASLFFCVSTALYADGDSDEEFTWAKYENFCWSRGIDIDPVYEEYVYYCENPQCLPCEDEEAECAKLFEFNQ